MAATIIYTIIKIKAALSMAAEENISKPGWYMYGIHATLLWFHIHGTSFINNHTLFQ